MSELDKHETKEAYKEALKEWMDDKFATFGKWTLTSIGLMVFGLIIHIIGKIHT